MTEQHECEWGLSYDYSTRDGLELFFFCKKDAECRDRLVNTDGLEKIYNEYETLKKATEALSVIHESIDDYLAPVTVKGTTKDEYVPVEASTLAWWMDAIEEMLEGK